jgi:hypothetical protein
LFQSIPGKKVHMKRKQFGFSPQQDLSILRANRQHNHLAQYHCAYNDGANDQPSTICLLLVMMLSVLSLMKQEEDNRQSNQAN